jgi:peptide/nickel transport system permease protein
MLMGRVLADLRRYPSAIAGLVIIAFLFAMSVYAVVAIPYGEAIRLWRGGEALWLENPRNARPAWMASLPGANLSRTIVVDSRDGGWKQTEDAAGIRRVMIPLAFDFPGRAFPQELTVFFAAEYNERPPHVALIWRTPDGAEIPLTEMAVRRRETYRISADPRLQLKLGGRPEVALFADPREPGRPQSGRYELQITALLFEETARIDTRLVVYGQVHGLAGTDHLRRDLMVALLWGTPVAIAFGLLAAVVSTVSTMVIAAVGVWYGRSVDGAIQRITEVDMILPGLPILIMIGTLYSRSIWVILGVVILLGVFGPGIKTYRALFLQVKEAPYIEAARAYGVSGLRMVLAYMIPRAIPVLVPQFVSFIPSFVFLEAGLAVLGLGDPVMPTWGKVIEDAYARGALFTGHYYWVLQPAALLMLTGLGFAMLGFALDRIFNPRLREI